MTLLKKLTNVAICIVQLLVDLTKDVVTLGGACLMETESFTGRRLREIETRVENMKESSSDKT